MKKLLILIVLFTAIYFSSCKLELAPVIETIPNLTPPDCVTGTKYRTVEFDYPYGDISDTINYLFRDGGAHFNSAFDRCGIGQGMIKPNMSGTQNGYEEFNQANDDAIIRYVVDEYKPYHYDNLGTGYLLAISAAPNAISYGTTSQFFYEKTSVIFTHNIQYDYSSFFWLARSKTIIHEIGHMIGYLWDNEPHSGRLADTCVMHQGEYSTTNPICRFQQFCDNCACEIYENDYFVNKRKSNILSKIIKTDKKSNIEINILSNKSEYLKLEPVWITVQMKNTGSDVDSVNLHESMELLPKFVVTDMKGNVLNYKYISFEYGPPKYIKLNSNEIINYDIELLLGYGDKLLSEKHPFKYIPGSYFSEGNYSVLIDFDNDYKKGTISSNKINFSVKSPENNELLVFNDILKINRQYDSDKIAWGDYIGAIKDLYNTNSIYSEEILLNSIYPVCWLQGSFSNTKNNYLFNKGLIEDCKTFFDKYPNSGYCNMLLKEFLSPYVRISKKSRNDVDNFLNALIEKYPSTKIYDAAIKLKSEGVFLNSLFSNKRKGN